MATEKKPIVTLQGYNRNMSAEKSPVVQIFVSKMVGYFQPEKKKGFLKSYFQTVLPQIFCELLLQPAHIYVLLAQNMASKLVFKVYYIRCKNTNLYVRLLQIHLVQSARSRFALLSPPTHKTTNIFKKTNKQNPKALDKQHGKKRTAKETV